jgi:hypothetical protein
MIKKILTWTQGRSTAFAIFFTGFGSLLAWYNKLTPTYVALITAIQGYVVLHSFKEDHFEDKKAERDAVQKKVEDDPK